MKRRHSLSRPLRRRSPDLQNLIDAGYCLTFGDAPDWLAQILDWLSSAINQLYWHAPSQWITVQAIPYVTAHAGPDLEIGRGDLAVPLWIENDVSIRPKEHWAIWHGDVPCWETGRPREEILAPHLEPHKGVLVLSQKPLPDGLYDDHYDKIETYLSFIVPQAQRFNPEVSAKCQRS